MSVEIKKPYLPQYIQVEGSNKEQELEESLNPLTSNALLSASLPAEYSSNKTPLISKVGNDAPPKVSWLGIFLAFLSGVVFTLCSCTIKYLTNVEPMELLIFRALFQILIVTLPIALIKRQVLIGPKGARLLLLTQGVVGGTSLVLLFYSYRWLPLGDAATIIFSSPILVMMMSHVWLREPCGIYRTLIVLILMTGVVLITKPPFLFPLTEDDPNDVYNVPGYLTAICGTVFMALHMVVMRKCKEIHFSVVVFYSSCSSFLLGCVILFASGEWDVPNFNAQEWILIVAVPVLGVSGQILVAVALKYEGAGRVAVTRSLDIVLAYLLQVTIFGEVPNCLSIVGAGLVIICVVGMGLEDVIYFFVKSFKAESVN